MKAIVLRAYGSPDNYALVEMPRPVPAADEVLIRVRAASINSWDSEIQHGTPFVNRIAHGVLKPKPAARGSDVAGTVEALGSEVERFAHGDDVFGDLALSGWGSYAEFATARESRLLPKPACLTFEEAAAVPQGGYLAVRAICHTGALRRGQKVLLNGAGGSVGIFALQLAKSIGAEVTAVDHAGKLEELSALGADHVLDFGTTDFTEEPRKYDLIVDAIGRRSILSVMRTLVPGGIYAMVGGSTGRLLQAALVSVRNKIPGSRKVRLVLPKPMADLAFLTDMIEAGTVSPVIDSTFPIAETAAAFHYYEAGNFTGKIVITVS